MNKSLIKLGEHSFVTKLAGFEHTKFIQHNATHVVNDIPLIIGKNVKNGKIVYKFDWYIPQNISDALPRSVLNKRCIVIPYVGSRLGELAIFENKTKCHLGSNVAKVELIDDVIDLEYLYYYLKSAYGQSQLFKDKQGSAQPNITMNSIRETKVMVFDKKKQQKIVSILSTLDRKIELNNQIDAELEAMAKTLYDYWFVQFDFPDESGKPYKSSGGKMVWSEELKREIPEGWKVDRINTKVRIGSGFPFGSESYSYRGKYKIITIKNVQESSLNTSTVDYIDLIPQNISDFCILEIGDILISLTGNVGRMCFVDQENLLLNQRVGKLLGDRRFVLYTYLYFKRPENQKRLEKIAGGSSQSNLSPIDAVNDFFVIPTEKVLNNFSKAITPIINQNLNNKQESHKISKLQDWLLPMLMNGQVTVGGS